jgi:hypothetical protein
MSLWRNLSGYGTAGVSAGVTKNLQAYFAENCTRVRSPSAPLSISRSAYRNSMPKSSLGSGVRRVQANVAGHEVRYAIVISNDSFATAVRRDGCFRAFSSSVA